MSGDAWTATFWAVAVVLLFATWRLWRAALREWRYAGRVRAREVRAREDVVWMLYRRQEYLLALKLANRAGDLEAAAVLFEESVRHATRHYPRLAAELAPRKRQTLKAAISEAELIDEQGNLR